MKVYMSQTVPVSIIRSFSLYTQQWNVIQVCWHQAVSKPVWHIPLLCVQWKTPDDGERNCPRHVEFHSMNKFEKSVHLVGFIIRNLPRCMVTWLSNKQTYRRGYTGCPTRYRTQHIFNNFTTNEDIATKFEMDLTHCVRNVKEKFILLFKFYCNIFIGVRIVKEMPGSVASGTPLIKK